MIIKKTLYPKTKRVGSDLVKMVLTEKLDGSNLCMFKQEGELYIGQRNYLYTYSDIDNVSGVYKGLKGWLDEHYDNLMEVLHEGSVICGEWIGMGQLHYDLPYKYYMFAKANLDENDMLKSINHDHCNFQYVFDTHEIPDYIGVVPVVKELCGAIISVEQLDEIYDEYTKEVGRNVEGFVINYGNGVIQKYVRMKNGKLAPHHG